MPQAYQLSSNRGTRIRCRLRLRETDSSAVREYASQQRRIVRSKCRLVQSSLQSWIQSPRGTSPQGTPTSGQ